MVTGGAVHIPSPSPGRFRVALHRASRDAYAIGACLFVAGVFLGLFNVFDAVHGRDAHAYWSLNLSHLYWAPVYGVRDAFYYSPAFAQLVWPVTFLPWPLFSATLTAVNLAALWWLGGRWSLLLFLLPPVYTEILAGNVNLLLAMTLALGFRYPAAWALPLLTKVTPGVGLLWFVIRREWQSLAIALGATAAVMAVSVLLAPGLWLNWFVLLASNASGPAVGPDAQTVPVPFAIRAVLAVVVVAVGALTNRPWLVPVAAWLSLPAIWPAHWSILLGSVALVRRPGLAVPRKAGLRARQDGEIEL